MILSILPAQVSIARASCGYSLDATNDASVHLTQANMAYRMTGQTGSLCYMAPEVPPLLLSSGWLSIICVPRLRLPGPVGCFLVGMFVMPVSTCGAPSKQCSQADAGYCAPCYDKATGDAPHTSRYAT